MARIYFVSIKQELKQYKRARVGFILSAILLFWSICNLTTSLFQIYLGHLGGLDTVGCVSALLLILALHHKPHPSIWVLAICTIVLYILSYINIYVGQFISYPITFNKLAEFSSAASLFILCRCYYPPLQTRIFIITITYLLVIACYPIGFFLIIIETGEISSFEGYVEFTRYAPGGLWFSFLRETYWLAQILLAIAFLVMTYAIKKPPFVCGVYEGKEGEEPIRFGILINGTYELYRDGKVAEKGKWIPVQDEIHITIEDPDFGTIVNINQINKDDSLTEIAEIIDGVRKDALDDERFTYNKV
mgnify:CR=1 FL=1